MRTQVVAMGIVVDCVQPLVMAIVRVHVAILVRDLVKANVLRLAAMGVDKDVQTVVKGIAVVPVERVVKAVVGQIVKVRVCLNVQRHVCPNVKILVCLVAQDVGTLVKEVVAEIVVAHAPAIVEWDVLALAVGGTV